MDKPYVSIQDETHGMHVSMITDEAIMPDELSVGCNDCFNGLSLKDCDTEEAIKLLFEWQDLGDSGCLCPACKDETFSEDQQNSY